MMWCKSLGVLMLSVMILGCSQGPASVRVDGPSKAERAKTALQEVVNTGQPGSGLTEVESYLMELKSKDAARADPLLKELSDLSSLQGKPDQAKAKAKELSEKL